MGCCSSWPQHGCSSGHRILGTRSQWQIFQQPYGHQQWLRASVSSLIKLNDPWPFSWMSPQSLLAGHVWAIPKICLCNRGRGGGSFLPFFMYNENPHHICAWLRLCIWLILNCREDHFFCLFATVCSSWVHLNTGTSRRSVLLPEGDTSRGYIQASNKMTSRNFIWIHYFPVSTQFISYVVTIIILILYVMSIMCIADQLRTILLFCLIMCRGGTYMLEQPCSSLMRHFFRFEWLVSHTREPLLKYASQVSWCDTFALKPNG